MKGREDRDPAGGVAAVNGAALAGATGSATTALAAVAPAAAKGLVAEKRAVADREVEPALLMTPPTPPRPLPPAPPVPPGAARAAEGRLGRNVEYATVMVEEPDGPTMP